MGLWISISLPRIVRITQEESSGRAPDSSYSTRRLQRYADKFYGAFADMPMKALLRFAVRHVGPAGALSADSDVPARRATAWSTRAEEAGFGATLPSEDKARHRSVIVTPKRSAVHVHVDDCVSLSDASSKKLHADQMLVASCGSSQRAGANVLRCQLTDTLRRWRAMNLHEDQRCFSKEGSALARCLAGLLQR